MPSRRHVSIIFPLLSAGTLNVFLLGSGTAAFASPAIVTLDRATSPADPVTGSVCSQCEVHCFAHVHATASGGVRAYAAPSGLGPTDLQSAYQIDPNITTAPVVAIVDAYGYAALESDLGMYRTTFGLPACTKANGCLTILNQNGQASPLPAEPPANDDWTIETALDVDMVSAACPKCKIVVVQGTDSSFNSLAPAQASAAAAAQVVSDSFGAPTQPAAAGQPDDVLTLNAQYWNHPGIAQFVSTGDSGYNNVAGAGPTFPSISDHVISVGGTNLQRAQNARGWTETAWTKAGSSCAYSIPKPAFQGAATTCMYRATSDISAVADPATGVAVYNAKNGGWIVVGGTSASSPLVAALYASIGHNTATALEVSQSAAALYDVTTGSNGSCAGALCNAGIGWDGPTGYGSPSALRIKNGGGGGLPIQITAPIDGATVAQGFEVDANITVAVVSAELMIDGQVVDAANAAPFVFNAPPNLAAGSHEVTVLAIDATQQQTTAKIHVTIAPSQGGSGGPGGGSNSGGGGNVSAGCNAGGSESLLVLLALGVLRRRRR